MITCDHCNVSYNPRFADCPHCGQYTTPREARRAYWRSKVQELTLTGASEKQIHDYLTKEGVSIIDIETYLHELEIEARSKQNAPGFGNYLVSLGLFLVLCVSFITLALTLLGVVSLKGYAFALSNAVHAFTIIVYTLWYAINRRK